MEIALGRAMELPLMLLNQINHGTTKGVWAPYVLVQGAAVITSFGSLVPLAIFLCEVMVLRTEGHMLHRCSASAQQLNFP
jgi:hypothetical protein